ncbi:hypothetical protein Pla123a_44390 [Posidoniimonas polymericola]|uniref:Pseudopilin GspJ n=1 Tax=Posidoniimonas polymericola TaxID=2528002 RepID=A0A5C5XVT4_9BACT|nr:prepilin-type N-terminal cleavage/methylation domain-containing protein [Posidoniimonas polymericola]TWT67010.1 hypothetical protein Pla123a_44390 [Posidoniimonas polymericola]
MTALRYVNPPHVSYRSPRKGFTLLEVLLAIALSTVLLALLASGINIYLIRVDASRSTVEQAQLARGVLKAISDDLRNVAVVYEQDTTSAEAVAQAQALFDVDEADADVSQDDLESMAGDAGDAVSERAYVGIAGDSVSVQADINRVRPAFSFLAESPEQPLLMSYESPGINTVRYYLTAEGLVREELPRDRRLFEEQQGRDEAWQLNRRVLAAEATELLIRYHDGEQSVDQWDIDEREGVLPVAVQITIGLNSTAEAETEQDAQQAEVTYYTLTIPMPPPLEEAETDEADATGTTSTGGGS